MDELNTTRRLVDFNGLNYNTVMAPEHREEHFENQIAPDQLTRQANNSNLRPASGPLSTGISAVNSSPHDLIPENDSNHTTNFIRISCYQIMLRIGWIFKTESIIMPAVLDVIGGAGWLRGCLPMLNRFGQSVPPLLASDIVRNQPLKKFGLAATTATMGSCFLILSALWAITGGERNWWMPILFLIVYAIFFSATGINQLQFNTINGKLIKANFRGRQALVGTVIGATTATIFAWILLGIWLPESPVSDAAVNGVAQAVAAIGVGEPFVANDAAGVNQASQGNFTMIFGFTGCAFMLAALVAISLRESTDVNPRPRRNGIDLIRRSFDTIREDSNFRRLTIIGALFGMYLTLFPHYQALGRGRLSLGLSALIPWVIAQNIGAALFSIPAGWLADRFGNRLVLRVMMLVLIIAPILALVLPRLGDSGQPWFIVVFGLLGLTPVTFRILNNYTLEVTEPRKHPRYLSTLSLIMAGPAILTSAFFGFLIDRISFEFVFGIVVICVFCGWLMTFRLEEPRNWTRSEAPDDSGNV